MPSSTRSFPRVVHLSPFSLVSSLFPVLPLSASSSRRSGVSPGEIPFSILLSFYQVLHRAQTAYRSYSFIDSAALPRPWKCFGDKNMRDCFTEPRGIRVHVYLWHMWVCVCVRIYACILVRAHARAFERNRCIILTRPVSGTSAEMKTPSHGGRRDTLAKSVRRK